MKKYLDYLLRCLQRLEERINQYWEKQYNKLKIK